MRLRDDEASASAIERSWRALADPQKIIHAKVKEIRYKLPAGLMRKLAATAVAEGDWDLHRKPIERSPKISAVIQHFRDGTEWEETELFARTYAARFARGGSYRGCTSIAELKEAYSKQVDALFKSMKEHGFLLPEQRGKKTDADLARVYIARDGEVLFGGGGNHRLAIATVLDMETFPCVVSVRHADWQRLREQVLAEKPDRRREFLGAELAEHPDMNDLVASERTASGLPVAGMGDNSD